MRRPWRKATALRIAFGVFFWLLSSTFLPTGVSASGFAIEGFDQARILAPAGAHVQPYSNVGYELQWIGDEVHVEIDASPLTSTSRYRLPAPPLVDGSADPIGRLGRSLAIGADTHYEVISRILGWVARNIDYNLDRSQEQAAEAVLERRAGYCTGIARLTVSLMSSVGIEAREVAGYVVGDSGVGPRGYHRWIEARVPDRGWVFSDPLTTHHYVPANYLRLASEELVPAEGMEGLLIERRDEVATVDLYPSATSGVKARRNSARQLAATLRIRLEDHSRGLAVLTGRSSRRTHTLVDGSTTFVGLEPGRYRLRLMVPGVGEVERHVDLPGRIRKTLFLPSRSGRSTDRGR